MINRRQVLAGGVAAAIGTSGATDLASSAPATDGWVRDEWIYPDNGETAEMFSDWRRPRPGTLGANPWDWESKDFRTRAELKRINDAQKDPFASEFQVGNPSAEEMAAVLEAEEARYEEQAKRFAEEAKG